MLYLDITGRNDYSWSSALTLTARGNNPYSTSVMVSIPASDRQNIQFQR